ncbi:hypothetical protein I546_1265 [Mycobacterium kansasii 732]|uniref:OsmC-like protein n=1 Tax=Mycobacterium pseudokansasii TaxID=2341080 RepID=A0A498QKM1_9MYCO|nr:hypothetical protein [Mycobacterium pseudokansasii]EUA14612.1 hypothetical protein I546_1265 [Mycobacterium kansasii 732]KZS66444.1 hypothetical protein A4G27_15645 [Mycobacterium kansasii]MBY0390998.1 OsmC family protein [Mycobacterium pseudokansasii]VAZ88228.1 hypothetical protein LAUMK35_00496 [Mycobacterium pseudokansasii]VAZ88762.1 hypothetical protein LAUMK21_00496 [Mycobacterium pseudokansasii]
MTTTNASVDNGVNVDALLAARTTLAGEPQLAQFQWRANHRWVNGTRSRATIDTFYGLGAEQHHKTPFTYDIDHPLAFAGHDNGAAPVEYVLVALGGCLTAGIASIAQQWLRPHRPRCPDHRSQPPRSRGVFASTSGTPHQERLPLSGNTRPGQSVLAPADNGARIAGSSTWRAPQRVSCVGSHPVFADRNRR